MFYMYELRRKYVKHEHYANVIRNAALLKRLDPQGAFTSSIVCNQDSVQNVVGLVCYDVIKPVLFKDIKWTVRLRTGIERGFKVLEENGVMFRKLDANNLVYDPLKKAVVLVYYDNLVPGNTRNKIPAEKSAEDTKIRRVKSAEATKIRRVVAKKKSKSTSKSKVKKKVAASKSISGKLMRKKKPSSKTTLRESEQKHVYNPSALPTRSILIVKNKKKSLRLKKRVTFKIKPPSRH